MPSLMDRLDTLLTAATLAEEGLPEAALEILQAPDPLPATTPQPQESPLYPPMREALR